VVDVATHARRRQQRKGSEASRGRWLRDNLVCLDA
jgi:hypothetical protein